VPTDPGGCCCKGRFLFKLLYHPSMAGRLLEEARAAAASGPWVTSWSSPGLRLGRGHPPPVVRPASGSARPDVIGGRPIYYWIGFYPHGQMPRNLTALRDGSPGPRDRGRDPAGSRCWPSPRPTLRSRAVLATDRPGPRTGSRAEARKPSTRQGPVAPIGTCRPIRPPGRGAVRPDPVGRSERWPKPWTATREPWAGRSRFWCR